MRHNLYFINDFKNRIISKNLYSTKLDLPKNKTLANYCSYAAVFNYVLYANYKVHMSAKLLTVKKCVEIVT